MNINEITIKSDEITINIDIRACFCSGSTWEAPENMALPLIPWLASVSEPTFFIHSGYQLDLRKASISRREDQNQQASPPLQSAVFLFRNTQSSLISRSGPQNICATYARIITKARAFRCGFPVSRRIKKCSKSKNYK